MNMDRNSLVVFMFRSPTIFHPGGFILWLPICPSQWITRIKHPRIPFLDPFPFHLHYMTGKNSGSVRLRGVIFRMYYSVVNDLESIMPRYSVVLPLRVHSGI